MVNVRKGTAHSLAQTDFVGNAKTGEAVEAGMLVQKDTSGDIVKVAKLDNATRASATNKVAKSAIIGFAITNQAEGDAIESGKIGVYALGTGSVIETNKFTGTFTIADIGKPVVQDASTGTNGNVTVITDAAAVTSSERILGHVYDVPRSIYVGQTAYTVLPILTA